MALSTSANHTEPTTAGCTVEVPSHLSPGGQAMHPSVASSATMR